MTLSALAVFAQVRNGTRELHGRVIYPNGAPVLGATIVASGAGFMGWASINPDGSFHLKEAGLFLSVRHPGRKALLLRISALPDPVLITLEAAGDSARKMPPCSSLPGVTKKWIGGGLKVNPGAARHKGPVYGGHDSHWYVKFHKETLYIADGYAWHAGLPAEQQLVSSETMSVRSWELDAMVFLDLSGRTKSGTWWRWLGAPLASDIEYNVTTQESADYFDRIIESACFG